MKKEKECFEKELEKECFEKEWEKHFEKLGKSIKKDVEKCFEKLR